MSEGLSHGAFVVLVAAFIVEGAAAAEGLYFVAAAGEQVMLMIVDQGDRSRDLALASIMDLSP